MDMLSLVKRRIDDGRRLLNLLAESAVKVIAAGWFKISEDAHWVLFIATEDVDRSGLAVAYRKVLDVLRTIQGVCISSADIKLIGLSNPIISDMLTLRGEDQSGIAITSFDTMLGNMSVAEVYIYPEHNAVRQSVSVTYQRDDVSLNRWKAFTQFEKIFHNLEAMGVVSYTICRFEEERPGDENRAMIFLLIELGPNISSEAIENGNPLREYIKRQAQTMADYAFRHHHPEAEIIHVDSPL